VDLASFCPCKIE
jgi:hypothetical protein